MILPNIGFFTLPTRFRLPTFQPWETQNRYYSQYVKKPAGERLDIGLNVILTKSPTEGVGVFNQGYASSYNVAQASTPTTPCSAWQDLSPKAPIPVPG